MESQGWRKKSTVTVLYSYSYPVASSQDGNGEVSMREGERLILLEKSNADWWQVRRPGDKSQPFFAPANYLQEDGLSKAKKAAAASASSAIAASPSSSCHRQQQQQLVESRSDDCLKKSPATGRVANAELRKQRSTSMDAIMFLELLENEIKDMPLKSSATSNKVGANSNDKQFKSESLVDRFKKPRISKDLWERRKSWAVEELTPPVRHHPQQQQETSSHKRRSMQSLLVVAPPLPPRISTTTTSSDKTPDNKSISRDNKAPALPPKKNQGVVVVGGARMADNYSRVVPVRVTAGVSPNINVKSSLAGSSSSQTFQQQQQNGGVGRLSESLEKLAQQIQTPLSYPHPIPPPRMRSSSEMSSSSSCSPPRLPPKSGSGGAMIRQQKLNSPTVLGSFKDTKFKDAKDNYVNLTRPVTIVDTIDDIQSDESGINMSFNNPLFNEKEDEAQGTGLGSSVDLESSIDDGMTGAAVRGSESNLSGGSELEANYASSSEDVLSSKDSLNSIPSVKSENDHKSKMGSLTKQPPASPNMRLQPRRELFENWCEYVDEATGRPFYYNLENRAKSWKPPRRLGTSPIHRGLSIEEEKFDETGDERSSDRLLSSSVESSHGHDVVAMASQSNRHSLLVAEKLMDAARNRELPPVPSGWIESIDTDVKEIIYANSRTGARWYMSLDSENRFYYYPEDGGESLWALPQISSVPSLVLSSETESGIQQGVFYPEGSKLTPKMNETTKPTVAAPSSSKWDLVRQRTSKVERNSKTRSMVLTNFSGRVEDIPVESGETGRTATLTLAKTASLPRQIQPQWPTLQGGSIVSDYLTNLDIRVLQQGVLHKTKLTENGKKIRKNWTSSWVVLTDLFLFFFKESAAKMSSPTAAGTGTNKPELCVDLNGATIEWAAVKSSRKGVFQVTTLLGVQLLLQDEDETNAVVWFNEIKRAIQRLPCGSKETVNHYPSPLPSPLTGSKPKNLSLEKMSSPEVKSKTNDFLSPPSPDIPSNSGSLLKQGSKKSRLGRTKSTKVPFLSSTEDLTAAGPNNPVERQTKLRDKLRKFFVRRPTVDSLVKKGIWKDEPVFGCLLSALCTADDSTVPKFVQRVIELIESKQDNMKADGIYRASGNLSQIQKIRFEVDQYNWAILEIEDDVHVLTGCLKLFFRELKEPLIPCPLFERALQVTNYQGPNSERIRRYKEIVEMLPTENYDTLQYLLRHLLKITEYRAHNRMHISNLAIVFGPTLMWAATISSNLALDMMQQNLVVEALLNNYHSIFNR